MRRTEKCKRHRWKRSDRMDVCVHCGKTRKRRTLWRNAAERAEWKELARRASKRARRHGHRLKHWRMVSNFTMGGRCQRCNVAMAIIALRPPERYRSKHMGGSALHVECPQRPRRGRDGEAAACKAAHIGSTPIGVSQEAA